MAFEPIETQEALDAIINERIGRAKESTKKEFEGWMSPEDVKEKTSGLEKKVGDLTPALSAANDKVSEFEKKISEKDKTIKGYETDSVKTRVAHEMGLSFEAVAFLKGEDEESIKESAKTLKGLVGAGGSPLGDPESSGEDDNRGRKLTLLKDLRGEK